MRNPTSRIVITWSLHSCLPGGRVLPTPHARTAAADPRCRIARHGPGVQPGVRGVAPNGVGATPPRSGGDAESDCARQRSLAEARGLAAIRPRLPASLQTHCRPSDAAGIDRSRSPSSLREARRRRRARHVRRGTRPPPVLERRSSWPRRCAAGFGTHQSAPGADDRYRFFGGLDIAETGALLDISEATLLRDWRAAKAWLATRLTRGR